MPNTQNSSVEEARRLFRESKITQQEYEQILDALNLRTGAKPRLRRAIPVERAWSEREIGGLCAGIARWLQVNPWLVRGCFILFSVITGGLGAVVYVALCLLTRTDGSRDSAPARFPWRFLAYMSSVAMTTYVLGAWVVPRQSSALSKFGGQLPSTTRWATRYFENHGGILSGIVVPMLATAALTGFLYSLPEKGVVRRILAWSLPALAIAVLILAVIAVSQPFVM